MFNVEGCENNCALTNNNDLDEYSLADFKNYSIQAANKEIRRGKENIIRINVLDRYIDFLRGYKERTKIKVRKSKREELETYYNESWVSENIFSSDLDIFALCISGKLYSKFKRDNPEIKQIKLCQILNIRENKLKKAKKLVKYKLLKR